jgi:stress-induced morphogen
MPVNLEELEKAIRTALPVHHLEIEDRSSGCGENYAIVLVSEVRGAVAAA